MSIQKILSKQQHRHRHDVMHDLEFPHPLEGAIFVGHTATDMDSIGSAIAAAELFKV